MTQVTLGALAGHFGRDLERGVAKAVGIIEVSQRDGVDLLAFPSATLGGYIGDLRSPDVDDLPETVSLDGPELAAIAAAAGNTVVCIGLAELVDGRRYNSAVALNGDGILGVHRKVHQPPGESLVYSAGDEFAAVDTPVGRIGMLVDYDKTFPEAARTLALDGARTIVALSAWPASVTDRASRLPADRQSRLFDLYDCARAAENQVFVVSSNLTGTTGNLQFLGQAKIVDPSGDVLVRTRTKGGLVTVTVDIDSEVDRARRVLDHLSELRPDRYWAALANRME